MGTKSIAYHQSQKKHLVTCKCSVCDRLHKVRMTVKPDVMPRVFCPMHEWRRYAYAE